MQYPVAHAARKEVHGLTMIETVSAAGCVVIRRGRVEPEVLLIWTKQYPDPTLPKGKVEAGESLVDCALREVKEETGYVVKIIYSTPVVLEKILDRYPPVVRKIVNWYLARAVAGSPEDRTEKALISRVGWVPVSQAMSQIQRVDEIEALRRCLDLLLVITFDGDQTLWDFRKAMRRSLECVLSPLKACVGSQRAEGLTVADLVRARDEVADELAATGATARGDTPACICQGIEGIRHGGQPPSLG
jgi:ADP-ribose pyrophosphatase YjhB (NUDIX family)